VDWTMGSNKRLTTIETHLPALIHDIRRLDYLDLG